MTIEKSLRLQMNWKAKNGKVPCRHRRMVDALCLTRRATSRLLACCECGTIIPDQVLKNGQGYFIKAPESLPAFLS
jgi:hypothetical protein